MYFHEAIALRINELKSNKSMSIYALAIKLSMAEPEVHFVGTKRSAASAGIDPLRRT
jgi:hypothetical protein